MIVVRIDGSAPSGTLKELWRLARAFPGGHAVEVRIGNRSLRIAGSDGGCDASPGALAALAEFGHVFVVGTTQSTPRRADDG